MAGYGQTLHVSDNFNAEEAAHAAAEFVASKFGSRISSFLPPNFDDYKGNVTDLNRFRQFVWRSDVLTRRD
jgi:hypothetical protein